ncbi:MAG: EamA family transporter [Clostridia bacterium]|nr:EamA family transporter [Clostridia bacterium]
MNDKAKTCLALHLFLMVYSTGGIVSKLASGQPFLSPAFILLYALEILILAFYAIGWQQFIKRMPLSVAYANKSVTVVWGCIWGVLFFHEQLSPGKVVGAILVLCGIALYGYADGKHDEGAKDK